ncbi:hypothetical protein TWF694_005575 [Orbilia ellipsospora]|uniref:DUF7025 domain-containing protein n=1 Tax=Orbilia ellipsospora TaxID=2528407 RepID=A0AAV9WTR2_9PEZI
MSKPETEPTLNGANGTVATEKDADGEVSAPVLRATEPVAIAHVDKIFDKKGQKFKYVKTHRDRDHTKKHSRLVIVVYRVFSAHGVPADQEIVIRGEILCDALNSKLKQTQSKTITLDVPLEKVQLQHFYRERLSLRELSNDVARSKCGLESDDPIFKKATEKIFQLDAGIKFITDHYSITAKKIESLSEPANITFELLWTIFSPGVLAYTTNLLGEASIVRIRSYIEEPAKGDKPPEFVIKADHIDYNGRRYGYTIENKFIIPIFPGEIAITSLPIYPFQAHPEPERERDRLINRAEKALKLNDKALRLHLQEYKGHAITLTNDYKEVKFNELSRLNALRIYNGGQE